MKKLFLGITTLSLSLFCSAPLWAAPVTPPKPAKNVETRITSDQLTYLAEKQLVIFDRRPVGAAGERDAQNPAGLDRIVAERNVRMKSENRNGTCAKATYTMDDGVLLMEGDPRLTDGENTVTGETIKYFTEENRSEVMGGSKKRVEAVFSGSKNSSPIRGNR